jgi:excinuclease ABC subunit B
MRAAAADLDFEEAARLRDEIKRLRATELAVVDDPTRKYPSPAGGGSRGAAARGGAASASRVHKPHLDEMGIALHHEVKPARSGTKPLPRKPTLDEMGPGVESKPYRPGPRSTTGKPGMRGGWRPRGR